ncbi:MAG: CBS domain-containing protein [Candidatus Firestonebacteria bacterium]|nr:CBS domain-containing protein [Candidatus Firestonebacteria bacterium]
MVKAYEIATDKYIIVSPQDNIFQCAKLMGNSLKKYTVVMENDKVLGIVLGLDIVKKLVNGEITEHIKAKDMMTTLTEMNKNMELNDVIRKMVEKKTSQVLINNKIIDKDILLEYIYLKKK